MEDKGERRTRAARLPRMAGTCPGVGRRQRRVRAARGAKQREERERLTGGPSGEKFIYFFFSPCAVTAAAALPAQVPVHVQQEVQRRHLVQDCGADGAELPKRFSR